MWFSSNLLKFTVHIVVSGRQRFSSNLLKFTVHFVVSGRQLSRVFVLRPLTNIWNTALCLRLSVLLSVDNIQCYIPW